MEHWTLTASPLQVGEARRLIGEYARTAGLDDELIAAAVLAVSEAVTNAVMHAFPDRPPDAGRIALEAGAQDGELVVRVRDDGVGMRERDDSPGAGFGLRIIQGTALEVTSQHRSPGGTELTMRFGLAI